MALSTSTATAVRSLAQYRELVEAIYHAPQAEQETFSLEWKSEAALAEKRWQAELGKQILAFANRDPELAAKQFGGCGYIVVGARPGQLAGTAVYDTAKVEAWLSAYVGRTPEAPEWAPTYLEVEGKSILVLTVEPPKAGDPMWSCQRDYSSNERGRQKWVARKGALYIRRLASTEEAAPEDIVMLSRRLTATRKRISGITVLLRAGSVAQGVDFGDDKVEAWIEAERQALKPPPEAPVDVTDEDRQAGARGDEPAKQESDQRPSRQTVGELLTGFARAQSSVMAAANFFFEPDGRTREQYRAEVDAYLAKARERLLGVLVRSCYNRDLGRIGLAVRNETDDPMSDVRVELYVDVKLVRAIYEDEIPDVKLPTRPVMLGDQLRERFAALSGLQVAPYLSTPRFDASSYSSIGRRISIDNSGSARITFEVGDLYPRETADLDEFFLFVNYALDPRRLTSLTAEWKVVTRNLSGVESGTLAIPLAPHVPTLEELLAGEPSEGDEEIDNEIDD